MTPSADQPASPAPLTPEATFVIQLRTGSNPRRRRLSGRIEHVMSGHSAPFASLTDLLAFMARYWGAPPPPDTVYEVDPRLSRGIPRKVESV